MDIPSDVKHRIVKVQNRLNSQSWLIKFVEPENLHITLKFFGEINESKIEAIIKDLEKSGLKRTVVNINKLGYFSPGYIKVIWLGVGGLNNIMPELEKRFGFLKTPHLTIGRVKRIKDKNALVTALKDLENTKIGSFDALKIVMKKSTLTPRGPIYEDLVYVELV